MAPAPTPSPALLLALLLCLLASSATPAPAAPDSQPSPSHAFSAAASKPGLSESTAFSGEGPASAPVVVMDPAVGAAGDAEDGDDAEAAEGEHNIRVRDAGPIRFWSGSRYGRSGRSVGGGAASPETQQPRGGGRPDGSTFGVAMSLRSSGPVIQPRHDRFFMGSRYGKRAQGQRAEWRRVAAGGEGEDEGAEGEEEEDGEQEERGGGVEEGATRTMKEALRHMALPVDSEVFRVTSQRVSSALQPTSCIYTGIGNLYRCYEGRREGGVH